MKIIAIHDCNSGHKSQLMGIINYFSYDEIKMIQATNNKLKFLPSFFMEKFLFILNKELQLISEPKLIISIGKKSLPYAIYFKKKYPKAKLIFLMPSGFLSAKYGDLIFYHSYKNVKFNDPKYIPIPSAPHFINNEQIEKETENWKKKFQNYKKPVISVILGGDAKRINLNFKGINELVTEIIKIKQLTNGSIFISTSRRTGLENEIYLKEKMQYFIEKKECFFWGYKEQQNVQSNKNPYLAMLGQSDYVIVSGESISMISESCSLPSNIGVYIFFSKNFYSKRYINFHKNMYNNNHAKPIKDFSTTWNRTSLNSTEYVINSIKNIL